MSIVLPDVSPYNNNFNFNLTRQYGCQFVGMSFQNYDAQLEHYNEFFDSNKTAFVLRPKRLRFIPIKVNVPCGSPQNYSYEARDIKSDYYSYKI